MSIYLTGASGFVGKHIVSFFDKKKTVIKKHIKNTEFLISQEIVIHLAGIAHDTKNNINKEKYYEVNTELTKKIFDSFLASHAKVFIMLSSVKAVADSVHGVLCENHKPNPKTHYGKSKLLAERYILSKKIPINKRIYILRPCMIHGPNNKGNLNLLYNIISRRIPWILGSFNNKRSYCSIYNLIFVIQELMKNKNIPSGIYNVSDDTSLSTNEIVSLISILNNKKPIIWNIWPSVIKFIAKVGDIVSLPLNSERLKKLTESYEVSNKKILKNIGKPMPQDSKTGIINTFTSFKKKTND